MIPRVAVVGGGISGLAAAWELRGRARVTVYETAPAVGGKLAVGTVAGVPVDLGAEAVLTVRPEALAMIDAAGLGDDLIVPDTLAASIRAGGRLHRLPTRTMLGIPADPATLEGSLLSQETVARIAAEPRLPPLPPLHADISVGELVRARYGDEVVDRLVDPLLGGVYAGRADRLSLRATMPALAGALAAGGSLLHAAAAVTDTGTRAPTGRPVFASLRGGIGRLPAALASVLRDDHAVQLRTGTTVRAIRRDTAGYVLTVGAVPEAREEPVDAVVIAVPAPKAARLLAGLAPAAAAGLAAVPTASMAIATLAYRGVGLPPGSGVLVASREGLSVKASTFSSQKWPMDTGGLTVLRASVGRAGEPETLQRSDDDLLAQVRRDLRDLLALTADPVDAVVTRWGGALPQYRPGHVEMVAGVRAALTGLPGLAVCGAAYDGVGIPACIASGHTAAHRVLDDVTAGGQ